jgi:hypothetical protein
LELPWNRRKNRKKTQSVKKALLLLIAVLVVADAAILLVLRPRPFALLDATLGKDASDSRKLLEILALNESHAGLPTNAHGMTMLNEIQHLALLRLLELQGGLFKTSIPAPAADSVGIDQSFAHVHGTNGSNLIILGTPSLKPVRYDRPGEGYWDMQLFEFTREGRLVSRRAFTNG